MIAFRDAEDEAALGTAGILRIVTERNGTAEAGLLVIDSRGGPVAFSHATSHIAAPAMWPDGGVARAAAGVLLPALFRACQASPVLLLARAEEIPRTLVADDLRLGLPVCLLVTPPDGVGERWPFWEPAPPAIDSAAARLFATLERRALLDEPFLRVARVLEAVGAGNDPTAA